MNEDVLDLPKRLDAAAAQELKSVLLEKLSSPCSLTINCSETTFLSTLGIQVLLAAIKSSKNNQSSCQFTGMSDSLIGDLSILGLSNIIED